MTLSDISIKNNVFAWMLMLGLIVFGAIGFSMLGISQLPDIDFPVLTVSVSWEGADPETMESSVADVIEDAVMSIADIRSVSSVSGEGYTNILIEFEMSRNIDAALEEVQTKVTQSQNSLPSTINPPVVIKSNPEDQPIMFATIYGLPNRRDLVLFARDFLKDKLATTAGVGDVRMGGYIDPNMRIWLNPTLMNRYQVTVSDIIDAISSQHTLTPSGYMDKANKESTVRVLSEARTENDFRKIIISTRHGVPIWVPIRLGDIAKIQEGLDDIRRLARTNGNPTVGLGVVKQRGSNAVAVARAVKRRIKSLRNLLPKDMIMKVVFDSTVFIQNSIDELKSNLFLSVLLTCIVCYLFLGSFSSAFNVLLAIPTALAGSFLVMYFCGFTLNTFTLLALSLSIGIIVDDAIMMMENIVRHHEGGMTRIKAAILGAREITPAAIAASSAILAIFVPVVFMKGIIGKFFFQFGIAMSAAIAFSLLEALTIAPMLCSQILTTGKDTRLSRMMDHIMKTVSSKYKGALIWSLDHKKYVLGTAGVIFTASMLLLIGMNKEFTPPQDQGRFIVNALTPLGSSIDFTDEQTKAAEQIIASRPEVESYISIVGGSIGAAGAAGQVNQSSLLVTMKNKKKRTITPPFKKIPTQQEFAVYVRSQLKTIPGIQRVSVLDPSLMGFSAQRGYPIQFSVQGPDWNKLAAYGDDLMKRISESGLMTDVDTDYNVGAPELRVIPDRLQASEHGVTITSIADTISAAVGSIRVDKYTDASNHRDDIRVELDRKYNKDVTDIKNLTVRNVQGELVSLGEVVRIEPRNMMMSVTRYNRERAITIFANMAPGKSQEDALTFIQKTAKQVLPEGYHVLLTGSSQTYRESLDSLLLALVLGIFVAYMILGTQFNSFIHPIVILLALPFSVTGAFIALRLTGISLNIYSMIGLLLLMGIVKKNSILLVDFTNTRRVEGMGIREALLSACPIRLRPILMTSIATIVAAIPPALSSSAGSETTRPMAVVVIGGVLFSTLLTLFVVPCAYTLFSRFESKTHGKELRKTIDELRNADMAELLEQMPTRTSSVKNAHKEKGG
ncbi:MAG TPA: efflux RND transporter permease subunit [Spirochaetota bacterium]